MVLVMSPAPTTASDAAALWLERSPHDFKRKKPSIKVPPSGRSEVRANEIIAAQQRADDVKKAKDLVDTEQKSDLTRREHSMLVAERLKKTASLAQLRELNAALEVKVRSSEEEGGALHARLAALHAGHVRASPSRAACARKRKLEKHTEKTGYNEKK